MPVAYVHGSVRHYGDGPYPLPVKEKDWNRVLAIWEGRIAKDMPMERPSQINGWTGRIWVNDAR